MVQINVTPTKVTVINASEFLKGENKYIENVVVKALQKQVDDDFAPAWGITAKLDFFGGDSARERADIMMDNCSYAKGAWWLVLLDSSDIAGVQGYHDVTQEGMPIGKVFVQTDDQYGRQWTTSASHELLEMLVDPGMNLTVFRPTDAAAASGQLYAYEVCDPCDADEYPIPVNGKSIQVSNFVYPAWFEWFHKPGTVPFAHKNSEQMNEPFKVLPGGHINVLDIPYGMGWHQISSAPASRPRMCYRYRLQSRVGSRRARRRILGTGDWENPEIDSN